MNIKPKYRGDFEMETSQIMPIIIGITLSIVGVLMIIFNKKLAKGELFMLNKAYKMGLTEAQIPFSRGMFVIGGIACCIMSYIWLFRVAR